MNHEFTRMNTKLSNGLRTVMCAIAKAWWECFSALVAAVARAWLELGKERASRLLAKAAANFPQSRATAFPSEFPSSHPQGASRSASPEKLCQSPS